MSNKRIKPSIDSLLNCRFDSSAVDYESLSQTDSQQKKTLFQKSLKGKENSKTTKESQLIDVRQKEWTQNKETSEGNADSKEMVMKSFKFDIRNAKTLNTSFY